MEGHRLTKVVRGLSQLQYLRLSIDSLSGMECSLANRDPACHLLTCDGISGKDREWVASCLGSLRVCRIGVAGHSDLSQIFSIILNQHYNAATEATDARFQRVIVLFVMREATVPREKFYIWNC